MHSSVSILVNCLPFKFQNKMEPSPKQQKFEVEIDLPDSGIQPTKFFFEDEHGQLVIIKSKLVLKSVNKSF